MQLNVHMFILGFERVKQHCIPYHDTFIDTVVHLGCPKHPIVLYGQLLNVNCAEPLWSFCLTVYNSDWQMEVCFILQRSHGLDLQAVWQLSTVWGTKCVQTELIQQQVTYIPSFCKAILNHVISLNVMNWIPNVTQLISWAQITQ